MSASDKKKLRKEQKAAAMTERQQQQAKEAKSLKAYTITFVVVMALVVALIAGIALRAPVMGVYNRNTVAVTIGNHELSVADFNYFYCDAIENFADTFSSYGDYADYYLQAYYGYNPHLAANAQVQNKETGETWADYFVKMALNDVKWVYTMYDKAVAENFQLSEKEQTYLDTFEESMETYAKSYLGFSSAESYLRSLYGFGANLENYKHYYTISATSREYAQKYRNDLKFTDEDFREYDKEHYAEFCAYSFAAYPIKVTNYLKDPKEYSAEEYAEAVAKAEADAKTLTKYANRTLEALNAAIAGLEINKDKKDQEATVKEDISYSTLNSTITHEEAIKWMTDASRKAGDRKYFVSETTKEDGTKTVTDYTIILFTGRNDNDLPVSDVRHLLVKFEGGTKDEETKETVYSEEEKKAAKEEAEKILKEYQDGKGQTEEAFIALVKKYSDDSSKSTGGLFEDITPESQYVDNFKNWALEKHEKGDVEIIETEYGYHIMYYVGANELNYRDTMINETLIAKTYTEWETALLKDVTVNAVKTNGVNEKYIPS